MKLLFELLAIRSVKCWSKTLILMIKQYYTITIQSYKDLILHIHLSSVVLQRAGDKI